MHLLSPQWPQVIDRTKAVTQHFLEYSFLFKTKKMTLKTLNFYILFTRELKSLFFPLIFVIVYISMF